MPMSFKDIVKNDVNNIFFNSEEFAEEHVIDRRVVKAVVDNDTLKERNQKEYDGIIQADILYYVNSEDIPEISVGDKQIFDGKIYTVFDVKLDCGVYEVILQGGQN